MSLPLVISGTLKSLKQRNKGLESGLHRFGELIKRKERVFNYLYDFRDGWEHEITIEGSRYTSHEARRVQGTHLAVAGGDGLRDGRGDQAQRRRRHRCPGHPGGR